MHVIGAGRPRSSLRKWRLVGKSGVVSASTPTVIAATSKAACPTAGITIALLSRQALLLKRYLASATQALNDSTCFAFGGQFEYQIPPFSITNAPIVYPAMIEFPVASAGATTGQLVSNVGLNFSLVEDWLEYDDLVGFSGLSASGGYLVSINLQSHFQIFNTAAAVKTIAMGETAVFEIWERDVMQGRDLPKKGVSFHADITSHHG